MKCKGCNREDPFLSVRLGYCVRCIREGKDEALERARDIHVKGKIYRPLERKRGDFIKVPHFNCFHTETVCLFPLMGVEGSNADLNETGNDPCFHYSGHGAGV